MPIAPLVWSTTAAMTTAGTSSATVVAVTGWFDLPWVSSTSADLPWASSTSAPTPVNGPVPAEALTPYLQENALLHREQYRAACERARETLLSLLDPANRERAVLGQALRIRGSAGNEYEIHHGYTSNVKRVRDGARFCAHPPVFDRTRASMLPVEDVWIAQMLALQTDEAAFLAVAHRTWDRR